MMPNPREALAKTAAAFAAAIAESKATADRIAAEQAKATPPPKTQGGK